MQKNKEKIEELKDLVAEISRYADVYYNTGTELVPNKVYDNLYARVEQLEKETGMILSDSPTQKVGAKLQTVDKLYQKEHKFPAKSLDKTKNVKDYQEKFQKGEKESKSSGAVVMWKLDGSTLQVTFSNGELVAAVTRGDGVTGYDVIHNAPFLHGLPYKIPETGEVTVRGEVVMRYEDFEQVNNNLPEGTPPFENARNLANGTIRSYENRLLKERPLHFVAYTLVDHPGYKEGQVFTKEESLKWLTAQGFEVVPYEKADAKNLSEVIGRWTDDAVHYEYPVDGLVTALDDQGWAMQQPNGSSKYAYPMVGYALKWQDGTVLTTLREIEWSPSRTGLLNPVAIFDPVRLEGTTVTRATIHNVSEVLKLALKAGDTVSVYKANKIIPAIEKNESRKSTWDGLLNSEATKELLSAEEFPKTCPCCGGEVSYRQSENETKTITVSCVNVGCPAKHVGKYERLVSKPGLNVEGLAGAALTTFVEKGWLSEYADLFHLKEHFDEICRMEGFGEKSCQDIMDAIEQARNTTFRQFYYSLGIPGSGKEDSKIFEKAFAEHAGYGNKSKYWALISVLSADNATELLTSMDGIGEKTALTILNWYHENREEMNRYHDMVTITDDEIAEKKEEKENGVYGKTFVITGSLLHFKNRAELVEKIEDAGGKVSGSVSKKTDYLVNNDVTSTSGKNKKAKELGIPVINEEQMIELLGTEN